jgi:polysaccharide pyruvyl transferase WcaK-like protein
VIRRRRASGTAAVARIALWGNFGTLNLGNECTLAAALDNLRACLPAATFLCVCCEPRDAAARHGIAAVPMAARKAWRGGPKPLRVLRWLWVEAREWLRALRLAGGIDALLVTGTGVLTDTDEGTFGLPYQLFKWCVCTRLRGGRVLFVSVGSEAIRHHLTRFFLRLALRLAAYRSYRDEHSAARLRSCGIPTAGDAIVPDLAFSLRPALLEGGAPPALPTDAVPPARVAVGLFNYRGRGRGGAAAAAAYAGYLERIAALIARLSGSGYAVRIIIGDLAYDAEVLEDVRGHLSARGLDATQSGIATEPAASWEQLLGQLREVDFVIASRFHNVLLALLLGKPVVSVSYEAKNEALMQQMGLGGFCQTLEELDVERLLAQFGALETEAAALRVRIAQQTSRNRRRLEEQYEAITALLGAR